MARKGLAQNTLRTRKNDLRAQTLSQRFSDIATLVKGIKENVPDLRNDGGFAIDPWETHTNVRGHVQALIKISETIRHTRPYLEFLENSRDLTLQSIADDANLLEAIMHYPAATESEQESVVSDVHEYHTIASSEVSNFPFQETNLDFFSKSKRHYEHIGQSRILHGTSNCNLQTGSRKIRINKHRDSKFSTSLKPLGVVFHEGVHDQIFQMAYAYANGCIDDLGQLADDAEIYATFKKEKATIPTGIRIAYLEQFHEIVAFEQEKKFMDGLNAIMCDGYPETPKAA